MKKLTFLFILLCACKGGSNKPKISELQKEHILRLQSQIQIIEMKALQAESPLKGELDELANSICGPLKIPIAECNIDLNTLEISKTKKDSKESKGVENGR